MQMKSYRLPSLLAACLLAALCAGRWVPRSRGGESAPLEPDAAGLVRDLGSADFKVREAATRRLLEYEAPPPALRAAQQSGDREVARRARRIIHEITQREENAAFAKLTEFARNGEVDRFIELVARRPKWHDEDVCWQAVADLSGKLLDLEKEQYRRPDAPWRAGYRFGDFRRYMKSRRPHGSLAPIDPLSSPAGLSRLSL
jgi:hypothetical protein